MLHNYHTREKFFFLLKTKAAKTAINQLPSHLLYFFFFSYRFTCTECNSLVWAEARPLLNGNAGSNVCLKCAINTVDPHSLIKSHKASSLPRTQANFSRSKPWIQFLLQETSCTSIVKEVHCREVMPIISLSLFLVTSLQGALQFSAIHYSLS